MTLMLLPITLYQSLLHAGPLSIVATGIAMRSLLLLGKAQLGPTSHSSCDPHFHSPLVHSANRKDEWILWPSPLGQFRKGKDRSSLLSQRLAPGRMFTTMCPRKTSHDAPRLSIQRTLASPLTATQLHRRTRSLPPSHSDPPPSNTRKIPPPDSQLAPPSPRPTIVRPSYRDIRLFSACTRTGSCRSSL